MMHGNRERQRRKAQQQVGKQPNDGSYDGAFGSRGIPGTRTQITIILPDRVVPRDCAIGNIMVIGSGPL